MCESSSFLGVEEEEEQKQKQQQQQQHIHVWLCGGGCWELLEHKAEERRDVGAYHGQRGRGSGRVVHVDVMNIFHLQKSIISPRFSFYSCFQSPTL